MPNLNSSFARAAAISAAMSPSPLRSAYSTARSGRPLTQPLSGVMPDA